MPMFIKMGIHGTGYLGNKERSQRSFRKFMARRKVLAGYPIETPFESIDDVREYLSGDRIVCLLCGRSFRRIGTHLIKIHGISFDEYREKYNIPWTFSLISPESSELYRQAVKKRMAEGYVPPMKFGKEFTKMINKPRRICPFKSEVNIQNLGDNVRPKHPLTTDPNGKMEARTARKLRLTSKKGSKEFKKKMRNRPQCQPDVTRARIGQYWKGKKQTPEHIKKRFARREE